MSKIYIKVIDVLRGHQSAKYFRDPVDWQRLKLYDYPDKIKNPMDLLTVKRKLERREYETVKALRRDIDLIWDNAILYNNGNPWIKQYVDTMRSVASRKFAEIAARTGDTGE